jgi:ABC-type antimicrobial peptide transport system ATPase subunit
MLHCSIPVALSPSQERDGLCVSVRGLRKEFSTPDGVKVAVDGIDLTMYGGEIFVLLGEWRTERSARRRKFT